MKTNFLCRNVLPRGWGIFFKIHMLLVITLFGFGVAHGQPGETCLTGKYIPRTTPNLLDAVHGQFTQAQSNWWHYEGWCYTNGQYPLWSSDPGYDDSPGFLRLTGPDLVGPGCGSNNQDGVFLHNFPIEGDKTYTVSVRCKAQDVCHSPVMLIQLQAYDPVSGSDTYAARQRNYAFSTSEANVWEEFSFSFKMPPGVTKMRIQISNYRNETDMDEGMVAYIDNLYIGEGVSFDEEPSCKVPFDGESVKVDELGNVYVKNDDDEWEWFFPFIIHGDNYRKANDPTYPDNGWEAYAAQGFNAIITGGVSPETLADKILSDGTLVDGSYPAVDDAINAGLKVVPHLGFYYAEENADGSYGAYTLTHLEDCLNYINDNHSMNDVLAYFIDNEVHHRWDPMTKATERVMNWEAGIAGADKRIAPIYMLNGTPGLGPKYLSYDEDGNEICHVGDITSSYISFDDEANQIATNWRLRNLDRQHNQSMPANIAQINGNHLFRARIYGSIAVGARGMDYWRDFGPGHRDYIPNCYDDMGNPIPNCPAPNNEFHEHLFDHLNDGTDSNSDGILDVVYDTDNSNDTSSDDDTNGNGIRDIAEAYFDSDMDTRPDIVDADDDDDDGITDEGTKDEDEDGISDEFDAAFAIDGDSDGVPDNLVYDYNGDCEITTADIIDANNDGVLDFFWQIFDENGNGILDDYEIDDDDGDGLIYGDVLNEYYVGGTLVCGLNPYFEGGSFKPSNDITQVEWWDNFPDLVCEIYDLQDLIQQPHWTNTWGISSCVSGGEICEDANFVIGTRELKNEGYLIVANYGTAPVTATVTLSGLPFVDATLADLLTGTTVQMTDSQAQITLPYDGVGVYKIEGYIPSVPPSSCLEDIVVSANLSGLYEAEQTITTNSNTDVLSGANARLKGGYSVTLTPGFKAVCGSNFRAHIAPCDECVTCPTLPSFSNLGGVCPVPPNSPDMKISEEDESYTWITHYPNPFKDEVTLEFNLETDAEAQIIVSDVNGRTVNQIEIDHLTRGIQTHSISTQDWIPGIYFYQVQIKDQYTGILSHANGTLIKM